VTAFINNPGQIIAIITSPRPDVSFYTYAAFLISVVVASDSSVCRIAESLFCSSVIVILMTTSVIIPNRVKPAMMIPHAISIVLTSFRSCR
jgi:hypothetical protein